MGVFVHPGKVAQGVGCGHGAHAGGGLFANQPPDPVALFVGQLHGPAAVHLKSSAFAVHAGHFDQRQGDDFPARVAEGQPFFRQKFDRAADELGHQSSGFGRDDLHRVGGGARAVGFQRQPGLLPNVLDVELSGAHQARRCGVAAVVGVALAVPVPADLVGNLRILRRLFEVRHQQGVAAHFLVVVHAEVGVHHRKTGPVAALAQQQQPVVAQTVFLVGVGVAGKKILHFLGAGFAQASFQLPVRRPRLEGMAARLWQQLCQTGLVTTLEGFVHLHDGAVASGLGRGGSGDRK